MAGSPRGQGWIPSMGSRKRPLTAASQRVPDHGRGWFRTATAGRREVVPTVALPERSRPWTAGPPLNCSTLACGA
eukprot:5208468-Alexandrium_andersonii.AAC.1